MSAPLLPPPYDQLGQRPFSFYPAIIGIEHNQWQLIKSTWSEFLVFNPRTEQEIWIPRRFVGELSRIDDPVMIVGLNRELEYKAGQVLPHVRRVIEMPRAVNDFPGTAVSEPLSAAPVVDIRLNSGAERRIGRLLVKAMLVVVAACLLLVVFFRMERDPHVSFKTVLQSELDLKAGDDYFAVVRKLGNPTTDGSRAGGATMQYRVLGYPALGISVILMGTEPDRMTYAGAVDREWRPVHAVSLPGGRDTYSLLRALRPKP